MLYSEADYSRAYYVGLQTRAVPPATKGKRLVIRSGHIRVLEKSQGIINLIEQGITGAKRQKFNDLLTEINDFYSEPDDEHPNVLPTLKIRALPVVCSQLLPQSPSEPQTTTTHLREARTLTAGITTIRQNQTFRGVPKMKPSQKCRSNTKHQILPRNRCHTQRNHHLLSEPVR